MDISINSKFGIGEMVKLKGASQRFLIASVWTETCPGGTQILYEGVILIPKDSFRVEKNKTEWFFDKEMKVNETLLEQIQVEE